MIENDSANETNRHEKIVNLIFVVYTLGPGPFTPKLGVERTGPPDGGPVRVAPTGRVAAGGAWQTNDAANRRISR